MQLITGNFLSRDGYSCDINNEIWRISRSHILNFSAAREIISIELLFNYRHVMKNYAENSSSSHAKSCFQRFLHFARWISSKRNQPLNEILGVDIANYRAELPTSQQWYVATLAGLFRKWTELGHMGLGPDLIPTLGLWRLRGNKKGEAIQLRSVTDGALTNIEFESLYSGIVSLFEQEEISIEEFVLPMLLVFSGRRSIQIGDLQERDLVCLKASDGREEFILNIPRRKQRGSAFRGSFKPFALNNENGFLLRKMISERTSPTGSVRSILGSSFPLFPSWHKVREFQADGRSKIDSIPEDHFHLNQAAVASRVKSVISRVRAISERTGESLKVSPIRFRRTVGTRAAREGHGVLLIAELLDHTDTQNAHVYVENIPEHVDAINKAVARELAPIAQAFVGRLVDRENDAVRGGDPSSRIRTSSGKSAGTCGHFGFCGALAPISCYTCRSFQPWLDGPHEAVLDQLLSENDYIGRVTGDKQVAAINNRTVLAVTQVIELCRARKATLGFSNE